MNGQRAQKLAQMKDNEELRTAYHEAGHAVACLALGIPFECVTIVPDGDADGGISVQAHMESLWAALWHVRDARKRCQMLFGDLVMSYAGAVGVALCPIGLKRKGYDGNQIDFVNARDLVLYSAAGWEERDKLLRRAQAQAVNLIAFHPLHIQQVRRLARELLKRETLDYAEVQSLFEEAKEASA